MLITTESFQQIATLISAISAFTLVMLSLLTLKQTQLLNRFLKTPLAVVLNFITFLFFLATLATLGLTLWISLSP